MTRLVCLWILWGASGLIGAEVRVEDVPEGGMQPQVAVGADGAVHLVYLRGDPKGCEVRYARREAFSPQWSAPMTVNSERGSAVAIGTIRGAQAALGEDGSIHVVWNGAAAPGEGHRSPLWYAGMPAGSDKFEPQRNLIGETEALDGGASVAADGEGSVYVVWHARLAGAETDEGGRAVFVRKSTDSGATFGEPMMANADAPGVCACCSLEVMASRDGALFVLFRAARTAGHRDMTLLVSVDGGATFLRKLLDPWETPACPMSSAALIETQVGVRAAWETEGRIMTAVLGGEADLLEAERSDAKRPAIAENGRGDVLITWASGTGWNRGGKVGWMILNPSGVAEGDRGSADALPVWSFPAAYAEADGTFVILR